MWHCWIYCTVLSKYMLSFYSVWAILHQCDRKMWQKVAELRISCFPQNKSGVTFCIGLFEKVSEDIPPCVITEGAGTPQSFWFSVSAGWYYNVTSMPVVSHMKFSSWQREVVQVVIIATKKKNIVIFLVWNCLVEHFMLSQQFRGKRQIWKWKKASIRSKVSLAGSKIRHAIII